MTIKELAEKYAVEDIELSDKLLDKLEAFIGKCNEVYYNGEGEVLLTDQEYDSIVKKLGKVRNLTTLTAPSKRLVNQEHEYPELMGTLDKCQNMKDVEEWLNKKKREVPIWTTTNNIPVNIVCSFKEDGNSLVISYDGKKVLSALTRGKDGKGASIPLFDHIPGPFQGRYAIKYEVTMTDENFQKYQEESGNTYANPRSATNSIMHGSENAKYKEYLSLVPIRVSIKNQDLSRKQELEFVDVAGKSHKQMIPFCYKIITAPITLISNKISDYYKETIKTRETLNRMIDGVVVEYLDKNIRHKLGRENFKNNFEFALKFPHMQKRSKIKDIEFYFGKAGTITPVAVFDQVLFNGAKCDHVSLANYKRFKELSLAKDEEVIIEYRNDVLCYLNKADPNYKSPNPIKFIGRCPKCGEKLKVTENKTFVKCVNDNCKGKLIGRVTNFAIKTGMKGIEEATIEKLVEAGLITDIPSFTKLKSFEIEKVEGFQEISANNIENIIKEHSTQYDYDIIGSVGIDQIGRKTCQLIMEYYTIDDICEKLDNNLDDDLIDELKSIKGIEKISATSFVEGFRKYRKDIEGIPFKVISYKKSLEDKMKNRPKDFKQESIVLTGFRDPEMQKQLEEAGHRIVGSVSSKTTILVHAPGETGTVKYKKAEELGTVKIYEMNDFKENILKTLL